MYGLTATDTIHPEGVKILIKSREELLKVWSLSKDDRENLNKELEYLRNLLREVK